MKPEYKTWIEKYHRSHALLLPSGLYSIGGRCLHATREMAEVFPELGRIDGFVEIEGTRWRHAWCVVAESGEIFDPTVEQFFRPVGTYPIGTPIRYLRSSEE